MEQRTDLEETLLAGLPEQERQVTIQSIRAKTAKDLQRLRKGAEEDGIDVTD